jgi:hypothetical protein
MTSQHHVAAALVAWFSTTQTLRTIPARTA